MPGQTEHIFVRTGAHPRADFVSASRPRGGGIGGFTVTGIPPRSLRVSEIGDDRFALLCLFYTRINHLSSWHELLRVGQILVQLSLVPDNVRVLVGIGVVEPGTVPALWPTIPAKLGPRRFWPDWMVWQIPQVVRNNRSPSSSARTLTVKPMGPRVNASAHNAAEGDKKSLLILPPKLTAKPPPFAANDAYSRVRC